MTIALDSGLLCWRWFGDVVHTNDLERNSVVGDHT